MERWKILEENTRYELSNRGRVRVRQNHVSTRQPWPYVVVQHSPHRVSAWVDLWTGSTHTTRVMYRLMEKYWPGVPYPDSWRPYGSHTQRT